MLAQLILVLVSKRPAQGQHLFYEILINRSGHHQHHHLVMFSYFLIWCHKNPMDLYGWWFAMLNCLRLCYSLNLETCLMDKASTNSWVDLTSMNIGHHDIPLFRYLSHWYPNYIYIYICILYIYTKFYIPMFFGLTALTYLDHLFFGAWARGMGQHADPSWGHLPGTYFCSAGLHPAPRSRHRSGPPGARWAWWVPWGFHGGSPFFGW